MVSNIHINIDTYIYTHYIYIHMCKLSYMGHSLLRAGGYLILGGRDWDKDSHQGSLS